MIIAVACDLEKNGKYYPHIFYMNLRIMYENAPAHTKKYFQKELALIKQVYQRKCMLCRYWCFKDNGFKVEPHVSNKCNDILSEAVDRLNNSMLQDKGVL